MIASPYGFWASPVTSDLVVADSIRLEQVALDGDAIYWTETQPQKQCGRKNREARASGPLTLTTQAASLNGLPLAIVSCRVLAPLATTLPNRSLAVRARAIATSLRLRM
jgi:hypothetical protein